MKQKTFKVSQIRELLNQVYNEKITFSRFVEILNNKVDEKRKFHFERIENEEWYRWLSESTSNGLNEASVSNAIRDMSDKLNEIIEQLNKTI